MKYSLIVLLLVSSCGTDSGSDLNVSEVDSSGGNSIRADVWVDNWFAFYLGDQLIMEDSTSITTERSFNAESFTFAADYPMQLNFIAKDFRENDTGLEYIGARNQQMGDGGLIAQFFDDSTGELIESSHSGWKCLVIHEAPMDKSCENSSDPVAGTAPCDFRRLDEPVGWKGLNFDDSAWGNAIEHSSAAVDPKGGYDNVDWHSNAKLIWAGDLETDNTLLCRTTIGN